MTNTFDPHLNITDLVLVGCGGTGGQLARIIGRVVYDLRRRRQHIPRLRFVDPDKVERQNLGRQLFTEGDLGQYKAEILAKRFNRTLGLDIVYYNEPFDAEKHTSGYGAVVCGAVDNHLARRELAKVRGIWIDAGNSFSTGQVVIGTSRDAQEIRRSLEAGSFSHLPNAALLFPSLLEPDTETPPQPAPEASCADLVENGTQDLLVNDLMGQVAGTYVFRLLNQRPITSHLTYVDAEGLTLRSVPISKEGLLAYLD